CIDLVGSAQENCINLTNLALIHKDFGQKLALSLHNALQFCTNLTSLRLYICRFLLNW
ncbi:hypothetical protein ABPG74_016809, partial [Tetrahymena malaccensis]